MYRSEHLGELQAGGQGGKGIGEEEALGRRLEHGSRDDHVGFAKELCMSLDFILRTNESRAGF